MNDDNIQSLFPFYALGTLTDEEMALVEQYVETRPSAQAELNQLIAAAAELAYLAEPEPGTTAEKAALMQRIRRESTPAQPQPVQEVAEPRESLLQSLQRLLTPLRAPAFVALALLLVALTIWSLSLRSSLGRLNDQVAALESDVNDLTVERDALQTAANDLAAQNATLTERLQNQQQILVALGRSDSVTVVIDGTEAQPDSSGFLVVNAGQGLAFLSVSGLPKLTAEQDYQLWLIEGDTPLSAGVFSINDPADTTHAFTIDAQLANFNAVGVSVEPAGGSPQPTGDIVLLGARPS